jgi:hypothetical protein
MTAHTHQFDYDHFARLTDDSLVAYAEPLANSLHCTISPRDIDRLKAHLDDFDEYHLVYAIEIGTDNSPAEIASEVPRFLGRQEISVFCAADRALRRLRPEFITPLLISQVEQVAKQVPERQSHILDLAESLRNKLL